MSKLIVHQKIINQIRITKTKVLSKMMSSNEIVTLINALGTGSKDFDINNLRYGQNNYYDRC